MSPLPALTRRVPPFLAGLVLSLLLISAGAAFVPGFASTQPIAFSHAKHVGSGMTCTDCHVGAEGGERATLPELETCMGCHAEAIAGTPEEEKLRRLAAEGGELRWVQLLRLPPDVFFSHRRHVQAAGLACDQCHGAMRDLNAPPQAAAWQGTMEQCLACHQEKGGGNECNDCHR